MPDKSGYFVMSTTLLSLGIGIAATVEYFSRRFVKNIYLLHDGRRIMFTFHSAFTVIIKVDVRK